MFSTRRAPIFTTALFPGFVFGVLLVGMGFASGAEVDWTRDAWRLLGGTGMLSLATLILLAQLAGLRSAGKFMVATVAISWLAETLGMKGGWLFGIPYRYHSALQPVLPGGVPLFIPLAWFSLAGIPVLLLKGLRLARPDGARPVHRLALKSALGALGMVACDLALDPVAVALGLWAWERPGPYFGIPWLNFAGWWAVSFVIFLTGYGATGLDQADGSRIPLRQDLAWGVAQGGLLLLLGFGVVNWIGSPWPLLLSLAAMTPVSLGWTANVYWQVQSRRAIRMPPAANLTGDEGGG
jgi:uncharacterized membrane protein